MPRKCGPTRKSITRIIGKRALNGHASGTKRCLPSKRSTEVGNSFWDKCTALRWRNTRRWSDGRTVFAFSAEDFHLENTHSWLTTITKLERSGNFFVVLVTASLHELKLTQNGWSGRRFILALGSRN